MQDVAHSFFHILAYVSRKLSNIEPKVHNITQQMHKNTVLTFRFPKMYLSVLLCVMCNVVSMYYVCVMWQ